MSSRTILQVFDQYQKARITFVQTISELALRPNNIDILESGNILELLKPLLSDVSVQVQQCAAIALGRIIHQKESLARKVLSTNFLPILLSNIQTKNKYQKKSVLFVLRSICKHDEDMCNTVVQEGAMHAILFCLEDFEPMVKEAAAWVVGYIARHGAALAQVCVETGIVPLLVLCLQEPDLTLKQIAASALSDIAKHSLELAQSVGDAGAIPYLARNLQNTDEKLKRQILCALSSCAKHSTEMAEVVVEAELFPMVIVHLAHNCPMVTKNAACLVRDVVKHSVELCQLVANTGGIGGLMDVMKHSESEAIVPSITAIGYIGGLSDLLAKTILGSKGAVELTKIIMESKDDAVLAVSVWALGQLGKHSPEHAQEIAATNVFPKMVELYTSKSSSDDLRFKCKAALKITLQRCLLLSALEPLLYIAPPNILKYVLAQYSKILPHEPKARRLFVTTGALKKIQEIEAKPGTTLMEYITIINAAFPEEIVRYYSPGYPETLLEKVEQYNPQIATLFREATKRDSDIQANVMLMKDDTSSHSQSQEIVNLIVNNQEEPTLPI